MHKANKNIHVFRSLAYLATLILCTVAVTCFLKANRLNQKIESQSDQPVIDSSVDLSRPGDFTIEFQQTWQSCHGHSIDLQVAADASDQAVSVEQAESLEYNWRITDSEGHVVGEEVSPFTEEWHRRNGRIHLTIGYIHPSGNGPYTFSFTVIRGVSQFAGFEQRLVSDHQICIADMTPVIAEGAKGVLALVAVGILIVIVSVITSLKRGSAPGGETPENEGA